MGSLLDALKCLLIAVAILLLAYLPASILLGIYVRTGSLAALVGVIAALAVALYAATRLQHVRLVSTDYRTQAWSVVFGVLALAFGVGLTFVLGSFAGLRIRTIVPAQAEGIAAVTYGLAVAAIAAVGEEAAFRGVVQSWFRDRFGLGWALVLTSTLFCLWHQTRSSHLGCTADLKDAGGC